MKPAVVERSLVSHGAMSSASFGIDLDNPAGVLAILRTKIYSNKALAVLREYSSNAWDEHRESGQPDRPIRVDLPTEIEPSLVIRDYGRGIPETDIYNVYVKYGKSTKTDTNKAVGMLGIGAKSAFAYSDSFTVTSWHGGMKKVYVAVLDERHVGMMSKMHEEPCGDETGIEIKVAVVPKDIAKFQRDARRLYPFFEPLPEINIDLPDVELDRKKAGFLVKSYMEGLPQWIGVMGCVSYRIDLEALKDELEAASLWTLCNKLRGGLYFDIGEVEPAADREELEYSEDTTDLDDVVTKEGTKTVVMRRMLELVEEMSTEMQTIFMDKTLHAWEKRWKLRSITERTGLPIPREYYWMGDAHTKLYDLTQKVDEKTRAPVRDKNGDPVLVDAPKHFLLKKHEREYTGRGYKNVLRVTSLVPLDRSTVFLIKDCKKPYLGYDKNATKTLFVVPQGAATLAQAEKEFLKRLKDKDLVGVPVDHTSNRVYIPQSVASGRTVSPKHSKRVFVLTSTGLCSALSDNWDVISRVPEDTDVFVVLERFESRGDEGNIYALARRDKQIFEDLFDTKMPPIYGYKTTDKKPVHHSKIPGDRYYEWRHEAFRDLEDATPDLKDWIDDLAWTSAVTSIGHNEEAKKFLKAHLDGRHSILRFLNRWEKARKRRAAMSSEKKAALQKHLVYMRKRDKTSQANPYKTLILGKYPLLKFGNPLLLKFGVKDDKIRAHWIDYIKMVDAKRKP